jgi:hypothetical protein
MLAAQENYSKEYNSMESIIKSSLGVKTSFGQVIDEPRAWKDWDAAIVGFDAFVGVVQQP